MNTNFLNQTTLPLDGILLSFPRLLMTIVALPLFVTWAWIAETFHFFFCCMFPWNRTFLGINPSANAFTKLQTTIVYFKEKRGQCQILIGTQQNNNYVEKKKENQNKCRNEGMVQCFKCHHLQAHQPHFWPCSLIEEVSHHKSWLLALVHALRCFFW